MVCGIATVTMPKPFFSPRAEQSSALDLSADATSGLASHSRRDFVFVVNPKGANGRTGKEWKKLLPYLRTRLGRHCNAIREGADAVIAVGGDGTLHEVVNGFFWAGNPVQSLDRGPEHSTALGLIPLGTGSDFARTFGWKNDPYEAVERIVRGSSTYATSFRFNV